jgi:hypothetical protein
MGRGVDLLWIAEIVIAQTHLGKLRLTVGTKQVVDIIFECI